MHSRIIVEFIAEPVGVNTDLGETTLQAVDFFTGRAVTVRVNANAEQINSTHGPAVQGDTPFAGSVWALKGIWNGEDEFEVAGDTGSVLNLGGGDYFAGSGSAFFVNASS